MGDTSSSALALQRALTDAQSLLRSHVDAATYTRLRGESNAYEQLGKGRRSNPFVNRSALKLAEMDYAFALLDPMLPRLCYVDLCGGPGGFVEYVLGRCAQYRIRCAGVGMTLRLPGDQACNWRLDHLRSPSVVCVLHEGVEGDSCAPPDPHSLCTFSTLLGPGLDGDIYNRSNWEHLERAVRVCAREGAALVTADGGFLHAESDVEEDSLALLASQTAAALTVIATGGTLVLKTFSALREGTQAVVRLLCSVFASVHAIKPLTSRPSRHCSSYASHASNRWLRAVGSATLCVEACVR